ncbi:MAG TPA: hypothetical protein DDY68_04660 [Porphyromonadaceae bacterium]|nr:hypothetical protein [Porphyromonadaceae bacterium]
MKKTFKNGMPKSFKKIYRKATTADWQRYKLAKEKEYPVMIRARKIAEYLNLEMKIGDVEFQGDGSKATFYYIANGRVDFRELIKFFVQEFKVRIEMKQIGVRQESGRIGGLGPCGRPLCCASWMRYFSSVSTTMAHYQDIPNNLQRITGQCTKLKCCLNYEADTYIEAYNKLPPREIVLQTQGKDYYFFKADTLKQQVSYSTTKGKPTDLLTISAKRVFDIIEMNNNGIKPESLLESGAPKTKTQRYIERDVLSEENIDRFYQNPSAKKGGKKNKSSENTPAKAKENAPKNPAANPPKKAKKQNKPKVENVPLPDVVEDKSNDDKLLNLI